MGFRIVTAVAVVRTALHEYHEAQSGAVNDGVLDCSCNSYFHGDSFRFLNTKMTGGYRIRPYISVVV